MYVLEAAQNCFVDCSTLILLSIDRIYVLTSTHHLVVAKSFPPLRNLRSFMRPAVSPGKGGRGKKDLKFRNRLGTAVFALGTMLAVEAHLETP